MQLLGCLVSQCAESYTEALLLPLAGGLGGVSNMMSPLLLTDDLEKASTPSGSKQGTASGGKSPALHQLL